MEPSDPQADQVAGDFARAWNRHDMEEFANLFREDASFVNVVGVLMRGRVAIREHHTRIHTGALRGSSLLVAVQDSVELLPGVVICHVRTELTGDERAPGETRTTLLTFVLVPGDDGWKIAAGHNTNVAVPASLKPTR